MVTPVLSKDPVGNHWKDPLGQASWLSRIALLVSALALFIAWRTNDTRNPPVAKREKEPEEVSRDPITPSERSESEATNHPLTSVSDALTELAEQISDSIVRVNVEYQDSDDSVETDRQDSRKSWMDDQIGTGFAIHADEDCYFVTSLHVVRNAKSIEVVCKTGATYAADIFGYDALSDIAVLRVNDCVLRPLTWTQTHVQSGQLVMTLGTPMGLEQSVSIGVISNPQRFGIGGIPDQPFLQCNVFAHPGSSGSPLIDINGNVVGIVAAIAGEEFSGVSFALPHSVATPIVSQLLRGERVTRGWIGATFGSLTRTRAVLNGIAGVSGVYVESVLDGDSPAAQSGLRAGDICTAFNDQSVSDAQILRRLITASAVDSKITLSLLRDGQPIDVVVTVKGRKDVELFGD